MPAKPDPIPVDLSPRLRKWLQSQAKAGNYPTTGDFLSEVIAGEVERQCFLDAELAAGLHSPLVELTDVERERIRADVRRAGAGTMQR